VQPAGNSADIPSQYVWDGDDWLPREGEVEVIIGDLPLTLNLQFPHERSYALGLMHGLRNPQADIDRQLFQKYVRHGDIVLDAGANVGVTAAEVLACGARHVVCVEPEETLAARLGALEVRFKDRMNVWHCALGAHAGCAELLLSKGHNQGHTVSPRMASIFPALFDGTLQRVEVKTVDSILAARPADVWKLDVEGAEVDAIKGARQTLERAPPRIIFAELYDPFVNEFVDLLPQYQFKRVGLKKVDYALHLLDQIGGSLGNEFCHTSPTYLFTRRD
jgi:FkbM family methyltransferase